jgi:hypothetical protein
MVLCLIATLGLGLMAQQFMQLSSNAVHELSRPETYAMQLQKQKPQLSQAQHP